MAPYPAKDGVECTAGASSEPKALQTPGKIQKVDPPWGSTIYTIGVLGCRIGVLLFGSSQSSGTEDRAMCSASAELSNFVRRGI